MKAFLIIMLLFIGFICLGQSNKTLYDSVFKKGDVIKIPEIIYELSKPCCWGSQLDSLKPVVSFLNKNKNLKIEVAVHTDNRGVDEKNILLSRFRAESVWNTLVYEFKIDSNIIKYKGYGESKLLVSDKIIISTNSKEQKEIFHRMNRRTELIVLGVN